VLRAIVATWLNRILSLVVVCVYAIMVARAGEPADVIGLIWLLLPLACIWFGDLLGEHLTQSMFAPFHSMSRSPGCLVALMGWVLLLLPGLLQLIMPAGEHPRGRWPFLW
jgi:hypothetical protein